MGEGLFLSAVELTFPHPDRAEQGDAEPLNVACAPPSKFAELLRREHAQWEAQNKAKI